MPEQIAQFILPNGNPNGVKILSLRTVWNGTALIIPRGHLGDVKSRKEAKRRSVYFLFGQENTDKLVYIGQTGSFIDRIERHELEKNFWDKAIVFTGEFDSDVAQLVESRAIKAANKAGRYNVKNDNEEFNGPISEAGGIIAEKYFEKVRFIFALLEINLFVGGREPDKRETIYYLKFDDTEAKGALLENDEFIVYKGSKARKGETESCMDFIKQRREGLRDKGILVGGDDGKLLRFSKDYIFDKPSQASCVIVGRNSDGWNEWKDEDGNMLNENVRQ